MGNALNNPMNEERMERMQEVISDVVGQFSKEFPLQYKDCLIAKIKDEAQPEEEDERKLPDAPVPDYELKSGTMMKRGDINKGWKSRFFVALNEADNYRIDYFEKEGGKKKGSINCCGFEAMAFTEEDTTTHGQFGVKIVPEDERRRTWWLKCESEEEKDEWLKVLTTACNKAKAPVHENEVIAGAFKGAYRSVRWHYGFYGWYRCVMTEGEQLGALCSEIVMREVVRAALDEVPEGPAKSTTINMVRKNVDLAVISAVNAAWTGVVSSCIAMSDALEESVKSLLAPLAENEVKLKEKVSSTVNDKVMPFLEDVGGRLCQPLLAACSTPITKSYASSVKGFSEFMKEKIKDGAYTESTMSANIREAHRSVNYWWSGPLKETNEIAWNIYANDLADVVSFFGAGYTPYSLYSEVLDSIRDLTHRAIHAFATATEEAKFEGQEAILNDVLAKFVHDAKLSMKNVLNNILAGILQSPFETLVMTPSLELVKPIQDMIDEIPVPGLSDLFNLSSLTEEVLEKFKEDSVGAIVDGAFGKVADQIDDAGKAVGVTSA
jgi:hypothetical protein